MSLVDFGKRLLECAKQGDTEEVRLLMTNGAPFTTDWLGASPLHVAAEHGHVTTAEVFLRAGICRDARTKVDRTPLHVAAQEGHTAVVELLIKHGAEINAKDMLQMTPLHWAVERGHVPVIMCLLKHNADVYACSKFNKTPLDIAEDNCKTDIVKLLQDQMRCSTREVRERQKSSLALLPKAPSILPKPDAVPFKVIKTDVSNSKKEVFIKKERTDRSSNDASTPVGSAECASISAKTSSLPHPVLFKANLNVTKNSRDVKPSCSDSDEGDLSDQSCTNVLATLAALAEATAPNATISTQEALQWLETHGITMVPTDNSTIVASALEGGQTVSLTEAGKLALTWVKEHKQFGSSSSQESSSREKDSSGYCSLSRKTSSPNQLITIVTDKSQIPSIISAQQSPIFVVSGHGTEGICKTQPQVKKMKREGMKLKIKTVVGSDGISVSEEKTPEEEKLLLQRELEKMRKEAAEYKAQLLLKEHEAEEYRKQLEELKSASGTN